MILDIEEIYALKKYTQHLSGPHNIDSSTLIVRKNSKVELTVLEIINKYLPNLKEGPLLKNYLDKSDFRHEVKQKLNNFLLPEEKTIAKYISENLFRNFHSIRGVSQLIGNKSCCLSDHKILFMFFINFYHSVINKINNILKTKKNSQKFWFTFFITSNPFFICLTN